MTESFVLDERIVRDSVAVAPLPLCDLRLMDDARFPWVLLIPRRPNVAELIDLPDTDQAVLFDEIVKISRVMRAVTGCDKLNIAALGNAVRQLHVHIIARFARDAAWPRPVWGSGAAVAYDAAARDDRIAQIVAALSD